MKHFSTTIKTCTLISGIEILLAMIYLLTVPTAANESSSFAFGFSGMRFSVLFLLGICFTATALLFFSIRRDNAFGKKITEFLYRSSERKALLNLKSITFMGAVVSLYLVLKWLGLDSRYEYQITLPRLLPLGFLSLILFTQLYGMLFFPRTPLKKINYKRFGNWVENSGISARVIIKDLLIIAILLVIASIAGQAIKYFTTYYPYLDFLIVEFFLDSEMNIPTYFSAFLLLFSAALLFMMAEKNRRNKAPFVFQWYFLSFIFVYLAADEVIQIHEMLTEPMRTLFHTTGAFFFAWYIPVIPLLVLLGFYYIKFVFALPNKHKIGYIISGGMYIMGVIGFEIIGSTFGHQYGLGNFPYTLIAALEEFIEMAGIILFIYFTWSLIQIQGQKPVLKEE